MAGNLLQGLERASLALGLTGLWFTRVQLVMLPSEARRDAWYVIALALCLTGYALHAARKHWLRAVH